MGLESFQLTHTHTCYQLFTASWREMFDGCNYYLRLIWLCKEAQCIDHIMCCRKDYVNQSMCFMNVMWNVMIWHQKKIWYNKIPYLRVCTAYILLGRGLMAISSAWLCRLGSLQKSERKGQKGPTGKNLGRSRNKTSLELARERGGDIHMIIIWHSYEIHVIVQ